jgi:hypothetical protein
MPEQETAGRQPEWALMYALYDALRRNLGALLAARASPAAVRTCGSCTWAGRRRGSTARSRTTEHWVT